MNIMDENQSSDTQRNALLDISLGRAIQGYLKRNDVKEIMLNPDGKLWVETLSEGKFPTEHTYSAAQAKRIITIVATLNKKAVTQDNPVISGTLKKYKARFQGWLPPITTRPTFCIRKQATIPLSMDDWVAQGSITEEQAVFITKAIRTKKNIIICGGTGSGKTTLANTLLHLICETDERIVIIEDTPELHIQVNDHVSLLCSQNITMQDCLAGTLRMRPDRIIIGEVRDGAALDLLKAWNTGHGGGIATLHANSPTGALQRLEDLAMEASRHKPCRLIAEVVDIIIYMEKTKSGMPALKTLAKLDSHEKMSTSDYNLSQI